MQHVIDTIFRQVNPVMIDSEVNKIRDIRLDMRDIQSSIDTLNTQLNVWEKINPFSQSDEKKELKYLKDELKFYQKEQRKIKDFLRAEILAIIKASPPLRMKATVSSMEDTIKRYRSRLKGRKNSQGSQPNRHAEVRELQHLIRELDVLLENQFGFEQGMFREPEMVEAVLSRVLDSRGV